MKPGSVLSSYLELVDDNACFDKTSPEEYNIPSHKTPPNEDAKVAISHLPVEVEVVTKNGPLPTIITSYMTPTENEGITPRSSPKIVSP